MTDQALYRRKQEQGMALLVTMLVMFLVTGISMVSIMNSGEEAAGSGRSRVAVRAFHAADAGIQFAVNRIAQNPPNLDSFSITLPGNRQVQSRARSDTAPVPITQAGIAAPPAGYSITVGSGWVYELFRVDVTAEGRDLGVQIDVGVVASIRILQTETQCELLVAATPLEQPPRGFEVEASAWSVVYDPLKAILWVAKDPLILCGRHLVSV